MTMAPRETILVVDDEANLLALCESVLRKEGYIVRCATCCVRHCRSLRRR